MHDKNKETAKPKSKEIMELSRTNFLSMLKGSHGTAEGGGSHSGDTKNAGTQAKRLSDNDGSDDDEGQATGSAWGAVRENYLTDRKLALKVVIITLSRCQYWQAYVSIFMVLD